jgi:solute carrier family 25 citrate transporter 1
MKSAWLGALRAAVGLPYEHPLDCIKTVMQAQKKPIHVVDAIKMIYKQNGVAGFYKGYLPNTFRVMYKQLYRFPLMIYIPGLSEGKLKIFKDSNLNASLSKSITGLSLGIIDVFLINPLERLKVWLMTN